MEISHGYVRQDLPDEGWEEAGMVGFVPARAAYRANPAPYPVERVVSILKGFREDSAIPPVHVVRLGPGGPYRFRLNAGAHRFYCALAAGFTHVPAIDVTDDLL